MKCNFNNLLMKKILLFKKICVDSAKYLQKNLIQIKSAKNAFKRNRNSKYMNIKI